MFYVETALSVIRLLVQKVLIAQKMKQAFTHICCFFFFFEFHTFSRL